MNSLLVTLQLLLLLPMASLVVLAYRTSRADRTRQNGLLGVAFLFALVAAVLALVSLSFVLAGDSSVDILLSFVPPTLTLAACLLVARRALARQRRSRRRG